MTISRGQMPRQLYLGGGITQLPIDQMMVPRNEYLLGGITKSVKKAVKGAVGGIKDLVSSDVGKLALLAAGGYYLGGGTFGGFLKPFSSTALGKSAFGQAIATPFQMAGTKLGALTSSIPKSVAGMEPVISGATVPGKGILGKGAAILGGSALLSDLFGSQEQAQEMFARDPSKVKFYIKRYYKNLNKEATDEEAEQFAEEQTSGLASANYGSLAEGGRVGFEGGGTYKEFEQFMRDIQESEKEQTKQRLLEMFKQYQRRKRGNVVEAAEGGLMNIPMGDMRVNKAGVMERDYREEGGFVPVGIKEKADDVPAMLSKNEFVFTADAVRGAGDGDIDKGAQRLYNTMKTLENGGTI